jgi:tRNA A37 threonylcarbamoyladenosine synthetase subunit TsaC/SUA5/YrdC
MSLMVVAPCDKNHHLLQALSPETLSKITKDGTTAMFISSSSLLKEICRLNYDSGQPMVGSSANLSGCGQKFRVEDIEDEVKEAADLIVDYGLQRYHLYGRASLIMDFGEMKVLRMGSCYELFRERMRKFWGVDLPEDPDYRTDHTRDFC